MKAYHICWVSQNWINRRLDRHQPAACVRCLQVLLQVGVVVKGHPALVAHDVLGLQVDFVDVLRKVRVFAFAVGTFCLDMRLVLKLISLRFYSITPVAQDHFYSINATKDHEISYYIMHAICHLKI